MDRRSVHDTRGATGTTCHDLQGPRDGRNPRARYFLQGRSTKSRGVGRQRFQGGQDRQTKRK